MLHSLLFPFCYSSKISSNHVSVALPYVWLLTLSVSSTTSKQCFELTTSVPSTTSKQCFEQPEASFLVCSLVFIEYNRLLEVGLNFLISLFTFTFDILYPIVKVGHTDDYSHGAVKLSVSLVDKDAMKKISVTVIGYFEININCNRIF
ncbi:S1 RNA-binding domain-containing protein [Streptococcus pneumoniae]|nr:S1 RNA-binding domain-containing protein [Streptococcus pneumoniae]